MLWAAWAQASAVAAETDNSSSSNHAPTAVELRAANQLRQATKLFDQDPAAALVLLDRACAAHPFVECSINRAYILESLEDCEALIHFQRFLHEHPDRAPDTAAGQACTQMALICREDPSAYCRGEQSTAGDPYAPPLREQPPATQPASEGHSASQTKDLTPLASGPRAQRQAASLSRGTASPPVVWMPEARATASTDARLPLPRNGSASRKWGALLAGAGVATALVFAASYRKLHQREQDRVILYNECVRREALCAPFNELTERQHSRRGWLIGLGVTSGLLLSTGGVLWRMGGRALRWEAAAGAQPYIRLRGQF